MFAFAWNDCLTHHVHILEMNGESFRAQAEQKQNLSRPSGIRLTPRAHRSLPRAPRPLPHDRQRKELQLERRTATESIAEC